MQAWENVNSGECSEISLWLIASCGIYLAFYIWSDVSCMYYSRKSLCSFGELKRFNKPIFCLVKNFYSYVCTILMSFYFVNNIITNIVLNYAWLLHVMFLFRVVPLCQKVQFWYSGEKCGRQTGRSSLGYSVQPYILSWWPVFVG